ncbi:hypothetical protein ILUMI_20893 [Ignelater luminosus]|uniref:Transposase n=1 Tax=Ignelater luminosus TaxID=2038154 RepID=A0A8K0FYH2_IGNLU|nr:hypothetical protein ILUMI_20893 [Ignelater luminosus]
MAFLGFQLFSWQVDIARLGYQNRHSKLSLRKLEAIPASRAMGFNKAVANRFFDLMEKVVERYGLTVEKISHVDKTGITVNPKTQSRVSSLKRRRQVEVLTSADRRQTYICYWASRAYMLPMLVFPRKRLQQELQLGKSPGA